MVNTKEAIKWVEGIYVDSENTAQEKEDIIELLQRGEKYEKIVKEMEEFLEPGVIIEIPEGMIGSRHIDIIKYTFGKIKRKYFPEIEQVLILSIKGEKKEVNEKARDIKNYFKDTIVDVKEGTRGERINDTVKRR